MSHAQNIVTAILESGTDPEEFLSGIPFERLAGYEVIASGQDHVHYRGNHDSPGLHLVYRNDSNGRTRTYIGTLIKDAEGWMPWTVSKRTREVKAEREHWADREQACHNLNNTYNNLNPE